MEFGVLLLTKTRLINNQFVDRMWKTTAEHYARLSL